MEAEYRDFIRFVCAAWYDAHEFIMDNVDLLGGEIAHYKMVQGTRNHITLMRIGQQTQETEDWGSAVTSMVDPDGAMDK